MTIFRLSTFTTAIITVLAVTASAQAAPAPSYQQAEFYASGSFTVPATVTSIDILAVGGGGGGGGGYAGGGGGGGEVVVCSNVAVTAGQSVTVTVGAGGAGAPFTLGEGSYGDQGEQSKAVYNSSDVCKANPGNGGGYPAGGNPGGAGGGSGSGKIGGSPDPVDAMGGGGAGASADGLNANNPIGSYIAGAGGAGRSPSGLASPGLFSTSGLAYGGGGGGGFNCECSAGAGGYYGGGNGMSGGSGGSANTGGGGGGAGNLENGGNGGSGYVEIRYIAVAPPANTTPPVVSGTPVQGQTITTDNGSWTGSPTGYTYKWKRCDDSGGVTCTYISSETASSYTATASDVGKYIFSEVKATNAGGDASQVSSNSIGPIIAIYDLTVTKSGSGTGTVTGTAVSPNSVSIQGAPPIDCGSTCTASFTDGDIVTLTATADSGSAFVAWDGDYGACSNTNPVCQVTMNQARTIDARFVAQYDLTVTKSGSGIGTVIGEVTGPTSVAPQNGYPINCGSNCSATFDSGTEVTLTASANYYSTFVKWSGDKGACADDNLTCTVTINQARTIDAQFEIATQTVNVTKSGSGSGTVVSATEPNVGSIKGAVAAIDCGTICSAAFRVFNKVTLTATADSGSTFTAWSGDCDSTDGNQCILNIDPPSVCSGRAVSACVASLLADRNIDAQFTANAPQTQTLTVEPSEGGTVTSDPAGIDCGTSCQASFDNNSTVQLTANPAKGYKFSGFTGACPGTSNPCSVTMSEARSVKASFQKLAAPKLEIQIEAGRNSLTAGQRLPVTINVENVGEDRAENTEVCFTIPTGFAFVSATEPYTIRGRLVCWELGDLIGSEVQTSESKSVKINLRALRSARSGSVNLRAAAAADNAAGGAEVTAKTKTKVKVKKKKRKPRPVTG